MQQSQSSESLQSQYLESLRFQSSQSSESSQMKQPQYLEQSCSITSGSSGGQLSQTSQSSDEFPYQTFQLLQPLGQSFSFTNSSGDQQQTFQFSSALQSSHFQLPQSQGNHLIVNASGDLQSQTFQPSQYFQLPQSQGNRLIVNSCGDLQSQTFQPSQSFQLPQSQGNQLIVNSSGCLQSQTFQPSQYFQLPQSKGIHFIVDSSGNLQSQTFQCTDKLQPQSSQLPRSLGQSYLINNSSRNVQSKTFQSSEKLQPVTALQSAAQSYANKNSSGNMQSETFQSTDRLQFQSSQSSTKPQIPQPPQLSKHLHSLHTSDQMESNERHLTTPSKSSEQMQSQTFQSSEKLQPIIDLQLPQSAAQPYVNKNSSENLQSETVKSSQSVAKPRIPQQPQLSKQLHSFHPSDQMQSNKRHLTTPSKLPEQMQSQTFLSSEKLQPVNADQLLQSATQPYVIKNSSNNLQSETVQSSHSLAKPQIHQVPQLSKQLHSLHPSDQMQSNKRHLPTPSELPEQRPPVINGSHSRPLHPLNLPQMQSKMLPSVLRSFDNPQVSNSLQTTRPFNSLQHSCEQFDSNSFPSFDQLQSEMSHPLILKELLSLGKFLNEGYDSQSQHDLTALKESQPSVSQSAQHLKVKRNCLPLDYPGLPPFERLQSLPSTHYDHKKSPLLTSFSSVLPNANLQQFQNTESPSVGLQFNDPKGMFFAALYEKTMDSRLGKPNSDENQRGKAKQDPFFWEDPTGHVHSVLKMNLHAFCRTLHEDSIVELPVNIRKHSSEQQKSKHVQDETAMQRVSESEFERPDSTSQNRKTRDRRRTKKEKMKNSRSIPNDDLLQHLPDAHQARNHNHDTSMELSPRGIAKALYLAREQTAYFSQVLNFLAHHRWLLGTYHPLPRKVIDAYDDFLFTKSRDFDRLIVDAFKLLERRDLMVLKMMHYSWRKHVERIRYGHYAWRFYGNLTANSRIDDVISELHTFQKALVFFMASTQ